MTDYHVSRGGRTLGVYPEPDARDYYAQGRIAPSDLVWREGMPAWVAASEVFGPAPQAAAPPPFTPPVPPPKPSEWTEMAASPVATTPGASAPYRGDLSAPLPPKLHWALVLLFTLLTLGVFFIVWVFIQAAWIKKIDPKSNAVAMMAVYVVLALVGQTIAGIAGQGTPGEAAGSMLVLIGTVVSIVGFFSMRRSMLDYYNKVEPIGLRLSGALTFFVGVFYLQYHMTRIAQWKQTGVLTPQ